MRRWQSLLGFSISGLLLAGCAEDGASLPSYEYRLWLKAAEQGDRELSRNLANEADNLFGQAVFIAQRHHVDLEEAVAQLGVAKARLAKGFVKEGCDLYTVAMSKFDQYCASSPESGELRLWQTQLWEDLGEQLVAAGENERGAAAFKQALISASAGPGNRKEPVQRAIGKYAFALKQAHQPIRAELVDLIWATGLIPSGPDVSSTSADYSPETEKAVNLSTRICDVGIALESQRDKEWAAVAYRYSRRLLAQHSESRAEVTHKKYSALMTEGGVLQRAGHYPEALATVQLAMKHLEKTPANVVSKLDEVTTLRFLGDLYSYCDDRKSALTAYERALAIAKSMNPPDPDVVCLTQFMLGECQKYLGDSKASARNYAEALAIRRSRPNRSYPDVADILFHYAHLEVSCKNYVAAEVMFREAMKLRLADPNQNEPASFIVYNLADCLSKQGKRTESMSFYKQVVDNCASGKWKDRDDVFNLSKEIIEG